MSLYPMFANLAHCTVLVVGGGVVAARKTAHLLEADASVRIAAPRLTPALTTLVRAGRITHLDGAYRAAWLNDVWLVVAATNNSDLNARVARHAHARRIFVNVVDDAQRSRFHVPARLQRGPVTVAISSGGQAPALARHVRRQIEAHLDPVLGPLAELIARQRARIRNALPNALARRHFHDTLPDGPVADALRCGQPEVAERLLLEQMAGAPRISTGRVSLVGAGPGDPGLLTLRALRAIGHADVIVHDRLVDAAILERARRDALIIDVGKPVGGNPAAAQASIHRILLEHARAGSHVVRLKGGDPMIFGRGGEELQFLHAHGVAYDVVPGVTAALACASFAGVALTQRGYASTLTVTTMRRSGAMTHDNWRALAARHQTLAIYMAVSQIDEVPRQLIAHGRAPDTPFALVEHGSRRNQRVITGRLDQLATLARVHEARAPALLIIGEVASMATQLAWFGRCIHADPAVASAA